MAFAALAALAKGGPLEPFAYEPAALGPHDVEIDVTHCGLCHSDIHLIDDGWNRSKYPQVPGHEIVGKVAAQGDGVTHLAVGQRAGVGWQRSACLDVRPLSSAARRTSAASSRRPAWGTTAGSPTRSGSTAASRSRIPDEMDSAVAAPLLCGGVTVYSPMRRFGITAASSVAVIGIGGLGHMALLMLRALGCEATAFSTSPNKRDEALAMGATDFAASTDPKEIRRHFGRFDLILSTVHAKLDWTTYLQTLRPNGTLCLLGMPPGVIQVPPALLVTGQRSITGSDIGSRRTIREMLGFAARHRITPQIERLPFAEANTALTRLRENQVRYRVVLER